MSKSASKGKSYNSKSKLKRPPSNGQNGAGNLGGGDRSYLPQVQQKIDNLGERERAMLLQQSASVTEAEKSTNRLGVLTSSTSISHTTPTFNGTSTIPATAPPPVSSSVVVGFNGDGEIGDAPEEIKQPLLQSIGDRNDKHDSADLASQSERQTIADGEVDLAQHLTNPDEIRRTYFRRLIEEPAFQQNPYQDHAEQLTSLEAHKVAEQGEQQFVQMCDLPLKLILTSLSHDGTSASKSKFSSLLEKEFGPLHVALQIGNVVLEWDVRNLVVPRFTENSSSNGDDVDDRIVQASLQHLSEWVEFTEEHNVRMRSATEKRDFGKQIELFHFVTAAKTKLIDNLVAVVVEYNSIRYYDVINRNSSHFVMDALKALGVQKPTQFTKGLGEYYKELKSGHTKLIPEKFQSHSALDKYIKRIQASKEIDSMLQYDLEFLLAQYFRFHLQRKCELRNDPLALGQWVCVEVGQCGMGELEKRIHFDSLRIHNFRTV